MIIKILRKLDNIFRAKFKKKKILSEKVISQTSKRAFKKVASIVET